MSIEKTYIKSPASLLEWMQDNLVPKYFASVRKDETTSQYFYVNANTDDGWAMTFSLTGSNAYAAAIKSDNSFVQANFYGIAAALPYAQSSYAAICENGAMISLYGPESSSSNYAANIIITKTNLDKTAIILTSGGENTNSRFYTGIRCVTRDDALPAQALTFSPIFAGQTVLVPFTTEAADGVISYTPNAFYMPKGQYHSMGFGKFTAGGKTYMSNGYWAILDA